MGNMVGMRYRLQGNEPFLNPKSVAPTCFVIKLREKVPALWWFQVRTRPGDGEDTTEYFVSILFDERD